MRWVRNESGIVGILVLAIIIVAVVVMATSYVHQVRSGQSKPLSERIHLPFDHKP